MPENRIVSLIASSTETICALGFQDQLVGRSHECDYTVSVKQLPKCSEPKFDIEGNSREIDQRVLNTLENALSVYHVHADVLEELQPTVIVTQDHCEVCAVSLKDVENAACEILSSRPKIVSLAPNSLADLQKGFLEIANALGAPETGQTLVDEMNRKMKAVQDAAAKAANRPSVVCVEWIDPLMAAGNWVPELVAMANGNDLLGIPKAHTPRLEIKELVDADPDKIVVMPCGWDIEKSRQEIAEALRSEAWANLTAVKSGELYLTDGNQYFNRPGPRVADSLEILAEILHPELCSFGHEGTGWARYERPR